MAAIVTGQKTLARAGAGGAVEHERGGGDRGGEGGGEELHRRGGLGGTDLAALGAGRPRRDILPGFWPGTARSATRWSARPTHRLRRCPQREPSVPAIDYEVTYILRPALEETDMDARVEAIAESIKGQGGEVVGEIEKLGKRRLAYEIDDVREGYYVVMKFKSEAVASKELERQMRLNEDVMRALFIKLEK